MEMEMEEIKEIEKDILKEIANIGVARVVDSFAQILDNKIFMESPEFRIVDRAELDREISKNRSRLVIESVFKGELRGKILFHQTNRMISKLEETGSALIRKFSKYRKMHEPFITHICFLATKILIEEFGNRLGYQDIVFSITQFVHTKSSGDWKIYNHLESPGPPFNTIRSKIIDDRLTFSLPLIVIFDHPSLKEIVVKIRQLEKKIFLK
ncbi:MAG TPA: chemotaxis protein CheC [Cyclobacteriaceae bacterium]|nr:chemotaxis protein CheC [Cyclobacteriaceae bacterium]